MNTYIFDKTKKRFFPVFSNMCKITDSSTMSTVTCTTKNIIEIKSNIIGKMIVESGGRLLIRCLVDLRETDNSFLKRMADYYRIWN